MQDAKLLLGGDVVEVQPSTIEGSDAVVALRFDPVACEAGALDARTRSSTGFEGDLSSRTCTLGLYGVISISPRRMPGVTSDSALDDIVRRYL